jgi:hypothetical protein
MLSTRERNKIRNVAQGLAAGLFYQPDGCLDLYHEYGHDHTAYLKSRLSPVTSAKISDIKVKDLKPQNDAVKVTVIVENEVLQLISFGAHKTARYMWTTPRAFHNATFFRDLDISRAEEIGKALKSSFPACSIECKPVELNEGTVITIRSYDIREYSLCLIMLGSVTENQSAL